MEETDIKATDAAQRRAEEAGIDLAEIEGTGADGQIVGKDVDKALADIAAAEQAADEANAALEEERAKLAEEEAEAAGLELVTVKLNPALVREGTTTLVAAGRTFPNRQPVTRADFEENLKPAKDTEGRQVLHIEREVK